MPRGFCFYMKTQKKMYKQYANFLTGTWEEKSFVIKKNKFDGNILTNSTVNIPS